MSVSSRLRGLLARPGLVRALVPHDAFTARICERSGAELLFLGGFGAAAGGYGLPDCLRITVGTEDQNRAVIDALSEFAAAE